MIEYFGKFVAAFMGLLFLFVMCALVCSALLALISGWIWIVGLVPMWAKWAISIFFSMVILAAIAASQDSESRW